MAVTLTGTGGLFTRMGKFIKAIRAINGFRGETDPATTQTWGASGPTVACAKTIYDEIFGQFASSGQPWIGDLYAAQASLRDSQDGALANIQQIAETTLIEMVHADSPLPEKTLDLAMVELIRQMVATSDSVKYNTTSISVAAGSSNVGTTKFLASIKGPDGVTRENVFAEAIKVTVDADKNTGGTAGSEVLTVKGVLAETDTLAYTWPDGSSASSSVTVIDPELDASTNYLTNSNFETWTVANIPDQWVIAVGTAGTSVKKNASVLYGTRSVYSLEIVGDGAELTSLTQTFDASSTGTATALAPSTVYAFNAWVRVSTTPAAGVLAFELVDDSGNIIADDAGTASTVTQALTAVSTTWVSVNGFIRTPTNLPDVVKLRVRLSTAMTSTHSVYIDDLAFGEATEVYTGGPYVASLRGGVDVVKSDIWTATVANNYGGLFQSYFNALFSMRDVSSDKPLQLPSATGGGQTISESLVA